MKLNKYIMMVLDVHSIETVVLQESDRAVDEGGASTRIGHEVEVASLAVSPTANGEENLEAPIRERKERD